MTALLSVLGSGILPKSISPIQLYQSASLSKEVQESFQINDIVTIVFGIPALVFCIFQSIKFATPIKRTHETIGRSWSSFVGLLCFPGPLLYGIYNYVAYAIVFYLHPAPVKNEKIRLIATSSLIAITSIAAIYYWTIAIDASYIHQVLTISQGVQRGSHSSIKASGLFLTFFGSLFLIRAMKELITKTMYSEDVLYSDASLHLECTLGTGEVANDVCISVVEYGTALADIGLSMLWIYVGGYRLLHKKCPYGYTLCLSLLLTTVLLFGGLILLLFLKPLITQRKKITRKELLQEIPWFDISFVSGMGILFSIPFLMFLKLVQRFQMVRSEPRQRPRF